MNMSKRQVKKAARNYTDKWGYSMQLSRKQRRGLRRNAIARTYGTSKGMVTLAIGANMVKDNPCSPDHLLYGGGSLRCQN